MPSSRYRTAPDPKFTGWPAGVPYIIGNEGCERFSFYGMKAILYVYITGLYVNVLGLSQGDAQLNATQSVHLFNSAVYAFPMIGAIIADRYWGKYQTILYLSIVYCFGHLALALFEDPAWQENLLGRVYVDRLPGLYLGLALIGIGSGGIKPCVSAHVGDQFGIGNWNLLQKVFNAFYFIINFGSLFSTLLIPWIRGRQVIDPETGLVSYTGSVSLAFGIPGILMGLATLFFWAGRKTFVHVPPTHPGKRGLLDVLAGSSLFMIIAIPVFGYEIIHGYVESVRMTWFWIAVACAASLGLFVLFFKVRQKIEQDDGFLAVMFFSIGALLRGRRGGTSETNAVSEGVAESAPGATTEASLRPSPLTDHWFFGPAVRRFGPEGAEGPASVLRIMSVFIFISVFWALFDQHSSTWIEQARQMNRVVDFSTPQWLLGGGVVGSFGALAIGLTISSRPSMRLLTMAIGFFLGAVAGFLGARLEPFELQPDQIPAANPLLVMILIPYTTFGLYPLAEKLGFAPTPLRRMTLGMFIAGLSFAYVALLQNRIDSGQQIHVVWQLIGYTVITVAEVMISITGLEFAYSQAPKRMKSVIMGFWLFNVTLGNVLVAFIARGQQALERALERSIPLEQFFWVFAGLMVLAAIAFGWRAAYYRYTDYTQ